MNFTPFSFAAFPSYDEEIPGSVTIAGDTQQLRCRMEDVCYQDGRILRLLIPHGQEEGLAPWGTPLDPEDEAFRKQMNRYPLIVHVQGSGWLKQDMNDHIFDLAAIARRGYVIAIVQYQEAPEHRFPQQVIDTKRALRYLQAHAEEYPIDLQHVFLSGDSSGGHTMLLTYLTYETGELDDPDAGPLPKLCGGLDFYGVSDFETFDDWWSRESLMEAPNMGALLGEGCTDPEKRREASPVNYIRDGLTIPPLLIIHGSKDTVVPFTQSAEMYHALREKQYPAELLRVAGADHGGAVFYTEPVYRYIQQFLTACLDRQ